MTNRQVYAIIKRIYAHGSRIFQVTFRKRTTGEIRKMVCRLHVRKGVKGVQPDRHERDVSHRLITVYEFAGEQSGFKCIPIDGIISIDNAPTPGAERILRAKTPAKNPA